MPRLRRFALWAIEFGLIALAFRLLRGWIASDVLRALAAFLIVAGASIIGVILFAVVRGLLDKPRR